MRDILWLSGLEYLLSDPLKKEYADLVKFISSLFSVLNIEGCAFFWGGDRGQA